MTDKQIIIDETKCPWFNDGSCDLFYSDKEECWYRQCKDTTNCYYRETQTELKRKEQECEELKRIRDGNFLHALEEQKRADKLSKTLAEIKEIAEAESYLSPQSTRLLVHKILQKISECEGNDEN